jgi:glycosidase
MCRPLLLLLLPAVAAVPADAATHAPPAPPAGAALRVLATPPPRSALSGQRIYFVLTDRFANGDRGNDRGGRPGGFAVTGYRPGDPGAYHGGDLRGLTAKLPYIRRLGATAIWITPPFVQRTTQGLTAGYHGYWGVDFTRVDPHLGTNQDFGAFVAEAHRLDLRVILDVVVNHTGDVISYAGAGAAGAPYVEQSERPYRDVDGRAFDPARYAGRRTFPRLFPDRRSFPYRPVVGPADRSLKRPSWLNDVRNYHNRGESTFAGESNRFGDFYGLDDLFTEKPEVVDGLIELYSHWIRRYRLDGLRLDTAQHVDDTFWRRFVPAVRHAAAGAGVRGFSLFGEVFDQVLTDAYVRRGVLPSVLDFPFQQAALTYAGGVGGASVLGELFEQDDRYTSARTSAYDLPTFLGNHDVGRIGWFLSRAAPSRAVALRQDVLAHELLFLLRGAPVVYYGDEVGMTGSLDGRDRWARQDMFRTAVAAWQDEPRIGSRPVGHDDSFGPHPVAHEISALSALTATHPALRNGAQITRVAGATPVFVVSRIDAADRREYVVGFNNGGRRQTVILPTSTPASAYARLWPTRGVGPVADRAGRLRLAIPARSALVLRAARHLPAAAAPRVALRVSGHDADTFRVEASVPGSDPATVTFVLRSDGTSRWRRAGADDARPFRLLLDANRFVRGRRIWVVALARSSSGAVAASKVSSFVRR